MIKFPMTFVVEAASGAGSGTQWSAKSGNLPPIPSAIPPEFMGPGGGYSPEDLFALSLLNCLIATFKVYAERREVTYEEIKGKVNLVVDRIPGETGFSMSQAEVFLDIKRSNGAEKARKCIDQAIKDCAVSNSIKTGKTFHINIS